MGPAQFNLYGLPKSQGSPSQIHQAADTGPYAIAAAQVGCGNYAWPPASGDVLIQVLFRLGEWNVQAIRDRLRDVLYPLSIRQSSARSGPGPGSGSRARPSPAAVSSSEWLGHRS